MLDVDAYGTVTRQVSVAYPRVGAAAVTPGNKTVNAQTHATMLLAEADVIHVDNNPASYRLGVPYAGRSYELTGLTLDAQSPKTVAELRAHADVAVEIAYKETPDGTAQKRVLGKQRQTFYADDLNGALPLGQCGTRALPYESESLAFSQAQLAIVFGQKIAGLGLDSEGAYRKYGPDWYRPSGRVIFDETKFYRVVKARDVFGNASTFTHDAHNLLLESATDPLGNLVSAENDYRLLTPWRTTDPNLNRTANAFDELGMVRAVAVMGKDGQGEGDTLDDPTLTLDYNLDAWSLEQKPTWTHATAKETHGLGNLTTQQQFTYHGGMGQVVMAKAQAEPGLAPKRDENGELVFQNGELVFEAADPRWVGTGRTVLDNKGNVIKQYEPFFSATSDYESEQDLVEWGVTPLLHYDPLGRVVRTDLPDGTFSRVEFTPWKQVTYDANDTVLDSDWYAERQALLPGPPENDAEIRAANEAAKHANTPSTAHTDHRGRVVVTVAHNRTDGQDAFYETFVDLDVEGNPLEITDARENTAETDTFAPGGVQLYSESVDAGNRWVLADAGGRPLRSWDSRGHTRRWSYDALSRPTHAYIKTNQDPEVLAGRSVYGESLAQPEQTNHRGQLFRVYDTAGMVEATSFDFKGNPLSQTRRLATDYTTRPDWITLANETDPAAIQTLADALLETETFTSSQTYDALNRVVTSTTPDLSVTTTSYGAGGLIASVAVNVKGAVQATDIVTNVDYNEKGQRVLEEHGNGAVIAREYDTRMFRVRRIHTTRPNPDPGKREVQDLRYHYDPSGNIAEIRDLAQQVVYFQNAQVAPAQKFVYDAIYRLLSATGREHATITQPTGDEWAAISHPGDAQALQNYTQRYEYDQVGNILATTHEVGGQVAWKRACAYALDGNQLLESSGPGDDPIDPQTWTETYTYDAHGNMLTMPHLYVPPDDPGMFWDEDDRLARTEHGGGGTTYYVYDSAGQRVRKVSVNQNGTQSKERLYFGAWETYRERQGQALDHERETLHVADGTRRMCLIETKTVENGQTVQAANIARYQYDNHLGTATLELGGNADVISYEEFHPYGTSSYRAANGAIDVSAKRYRYTGQERDEETGLAYHGARYYAPWLGRWTAADPIGLGDGTNRYEYTVGNPLVHTDPSGTVSEGVEALVDRGEPKNTKSVDGVKVVFGVGFSFRFGRTGKPAPKKAEDTHHAPNVAPASTGPLFSRKPGQKGFKHRVLGSSDISVQHVQKEGMKPLKKVSKPAPAHEMTFRHLRPSDQRSSPVFRHGTDRISFATISGAEELVRQGRAINGIVRVDIAIAENHGTEFRENETLQSDLDKYKAESEKNLKSEKRLRRRVDAIDQAKGKLIEYKESHAVGRVPAESISPVNNIASEARNLRNLAVATKAVRALGLAGLLVGLGVTTYRVASASAEERPGVIAEEAGAWALGVAGALGGATLGAKLGAPLGPWGMLAGGVIGGLLGGGIGAYLGANGARSAYEAAK